MRAISQDTLGGPEVLKMVEVDRPEPRPSEVLVRVHAAGVNPTDWKNRATGGLLGDPPFMLGWDVSGVVEAVGLGVTLFQPGDEVFGMPPLPVRRRRVRRVRDRAGPALARKPAGLDHVQAAALPLAALTAWQALVDTAGVRPGQRVLIHAAAGGVGHLAVQIAKARGAYVIGTASAAKHDLLRGLGADEVDRLPHGRLRRRPSATSTWCSTPSAATTGRARCGRCATAASSCRSPRRPRRTWQPRRARAGHPGGVHARRARPRGA